MCEQHQIMPAQGLGDLGNMTVQPFNSPRLPLRRTRVRSRMSFLLRAS